jgi:plasmid replication initiation protein
MKKNKKNEHKDDLDCLENYFSNLNNTSISSSAHLLVDLYEKMLQSNLVRDDKILEFEFRLRYLKYLISIEKDFEELHKIGKECI